MSLLESESSSSSSRSDADSGTELQLIDSTTRASMARKAFNAGDIESARQLHAHAAAAVGEAHQAEGQYIKSFVYGAMDGLITTFAVVSAVVGGELSVGTVLIMGFANMLGDGISMGIGDFLSTRAERLFAQREYEREMWECNIDIEGERREMVQLYSSKKGISEEEAQQIVAIISKDHETFVDIMMVEELGILPPDPNENAAFDGCITFSAFVVIGVVPLLPYVFDVMLSSDPHRLAQPDVTFAISMLLTFAMMFALGVATSFFTPEHWLKAGFFTMGNGLIATAASYLIAYLMREAFGGTVE
jgi:VIT1/CCC1 family predicted Fe2+/Mn2+ transporter